MSVALFMTLKEKVNDFKPSVMGGLSLGEWTALSMAGCLDWKEALHLVQLRGLYMQEACEEKPGAMSSILGLSAAQIQQVLNESELKNVSIANFNSPKQTVISGESKEIEICNGLLKSAGAKKVIPLKVAGAFHSNCMASAKEKLAPELSQTDFREPEMPVASNFFGRLYQSKDEIINGLLSQITGPVQWTGNMETMISNSPGGFFEVGPGKVLKGLAKSIRKEVLVETISTDEDLEKILEKYSEVKDVAER